jgi:predicted permease
MIARLAPGATLEAAQAQVDARNAALAAADPFAAMMRDVGFRSVVVPLHADHVAAARAPLVLMQAGGLALLLIAAANLVNLLLIRASGRARELAVRRALGAGRRHVIGEIVVETTMLAVAGGMLGLGVGAGGVGLLGWLGTSRLPLGAGVALDARVAAVALAASVVLGLVMALPIAWYYLRTHTLPALQSESRGSTVSRGAGRMRHAFLVAQIATAFVLVSGAGLLALSLDRAMAVSPGFRAPGVISARVSLWSPGFQRKSQFTQLAAEMSARLEQHPGVTAAGVATNVPLSGRHNRSAARPAGLAPDTALRGIYSYGVSGRYFEALGIPLREGRFLTSADSASPLRVAVVDEDFARRYWPGESAIGQRVFQGSEEDTSERAFTIVGVVGASTQASVTEDDRVGAVFYPLGHQFDSQVFVVARSALPAATLAPALRQVVRGLNQDLPVSEVMTMEERVEASMVGRRSPAAVAVAFAAIAALLAAIGTYGVLSYSVAQRRREIGVRIALGARPAQVRAQFLRIALGALALGGAIGLAGALAAGKSMQALLYGVPAVHLPTLAGAALVLAIVALPACLLPARRAARVSPMEALSE